MKVAFCLFFFCFICVLVGCSSRSRSSVEVWAQNNGKIKVLSTTAMIDAIVGEVGGDLVDHISLITGEIDPHYYELVKGDDEKISMSQAIFYNGLGLEHGASLRYQLEHHKKAVDLGHFILENNRKEIVFIDQEMDPHIWMDIALWSQIIRPIVNTLSQLDPESEAIYEQRGEQLYKKMVQAHEKIVAQLQEISSNRRFLVTSHDAFNYFARAYLATEEERASGEWKKRVAAPEGLAPEGQISAVDIQMVIDHLKQHHVAMIFPESNMSQDSLKKVVHACMQKGIDVRISPKVLYGDAMKSSGGYLEMIEHNAAVLREGWADD